MGRIARHLRPLAAAAQTGPRVVDGARGLFGGAEGMADTPVVTAAALAAFPSFGDRRDAGLEQLVGRDPEEVGDPVQVFELDFPLVLQKLAQPDVAVAAPERQTVLALAARAQQMTDIFGEDSRGFHQGLSRRKLSHETAEHAAQSKCEELC